ncbi:hypothetical protein ACOMHN_032412 [Nucella lapillus]
MSENQGVSSAFPQPPMNYINQYTDENIKRGRAPPPPPPPLQDKYQIFGQTFTADDAIIRPLEASGVRRLYPQAYDHKRELKKLNHSILINFLDLIDILIRAPDSLKRVEKLEDLNLLFINMHHLINEYRPHQARETLRVMMEEQKKQRGDISGKFQGNLDHVMQVVHLAQTIIPEDQSLDSKLLVKSELLQKSAAIKEEPMDESYVDSLDQMMCKIVDDMT